MYRITLLYYVECSLLLYALIIESCLNASHIYELIRHYLAHPVRCSTQLYSISRGVSKSTTRTKKRRTYGTKR
jgi:hypothetical protein